MDDVPWFRAPAPVRISHYVVSSETRRLPKLRQGIIELLFEGSVLMSQPFAASSLASQNYAAKAFLPLFSE